ncbi:DegT/DnrJ/EryC1/StrS family aminotransferase [Mucilaginibacter panaciglaebae]
MKNAYETNWIAPVGPHVNGFEEDLKKFLGGQVSAGALNSGTAAIHLALILLNVKAGDEVICQSLTFVASANPIMYLKATPVFVDSEDQTWNMSPTLLEAAIADRVVKGNLPKAIIVVHLYGMPARMDEILEIAGRYGIPVIEDAAEALGSNFKKRKLGTLGLFGIFSFNGNKIITTSGGGALVSVNDDFIVKARSLASQARESAPYYQHEEVGYNYRMSNICAGIGRGQMEVLSLRIYQRRKNFDKYKHMLSDLPGISFQEEMDIDFFSNRWLSVIQVEPFGQEINSEKLRQFLTKYNIEARRVWKPMHMQPVFSKYPMYENGVSEQLFNNGLCLPSGSNLTDYELSRVVKRIKVFYDI